MFSKVAIDIKSDQLVRKTIVPHKQINTVCHILRDLSSDPRGLKLRIRHC